MADDIEYLAVFDMDSERFLELMRSDNRGLAFRDRDDWQPHQPGDFSLDGHEVIEVDEDFKTVVDRALAAGVLPTRNQAVKYSVDGRL